MISVLLISLLQLMRSSFDSIPKEYQKKDSVAFSIIKAWEEGNVFSEPTNERVILEKSIEQGKLALIGFQGIQRVLILEFLQKTNYSPDHLRRKTPPKTLKALHLKAFFSSNKFSFLSKQIRLRLSAIGENIDELPNTLPPDSFFKTKVASLVSDVLIASNLIESEWKNRFPGSNPFVKKTRQARILSLINALRKARLEKNTKRVRAIIRQLNSFQFRVRNGRGMLANAPQLDRTSFLLRVKDLLSSRVEFLKEGGKKKPLKRAKWRREFFLRFLKVFPLFRRKSFVVGSEKSKLGDYTLKGGLVILEELQLFLFDRNLYSDAYRLEGYIEEVEKKLENKEGFQAARVIFNAIHSPPFKFFLGVR